MTETTNENIFLTGSLKSVFLKTALPIILMMLVNGSFNLIDAYFLGVFVGAEALTAVTSMFPAFMLLIAFSTLVSTGFASVMARRLGAGDYEEAKDVFAQAMSLSFVVCVVLICLFFVGGKSLSLMANNGDIELAQLSYAYIAVVLLGSPLAFILGINGDSLRCEGHVGFMSMVSLGSVGLNIVFNYLLIAQFGLGVVGSAVGTLLAQAVSIAIVFGFRMRKKSSVNIQVIQFSKNRTCWGEFLSLGAPSSLMYIGLSLTSAAILFSIQQWGDGSYATTVSAYGILTRLMTFIFLPLLGLSLAFQSIVGNNHGAENWNRTNQSIKIALVFSSIYCLVMQLIVLASKGSLGGLFVRDQAVIAELERILPIATMTLFLMGPVMIITMFFQSIGDAARAGILGLAKTYLFGLPLIFLLPAQVGEWGIWFSGPIADLLGLGLLFAILYQRSVKEKYNLGLFYAGA